MISPVKNTGYFNAIVAGYFKPAADGRMIFFPWGILGKGYVVPSQQDYDRLHRQLKIFQIVSLSIVIVLAAAGWFLACMVAAALLMALYSIWALFRKRAFAPSSEKISFRENMARQAQIHSGRGLWTLEIIALVFVAAGVALLALEPAQWLIALGSITFFGICAVVFACMLKMQRQGA